VDREQNNHGRIRIRDCARHVHTILSNSKTAVKRREETSISKKILTIITVVHIVNNLLPPASRAL